MPQTEGYSPQGREESDTTEWLNTAGRTSTAANTATRETEKPESGVPHTALRWNGHKPDMNFIKRTVPTWQLLENRGKGNMLNGTTGK